MPVVLTNPANGDLLVGTMFTTETKKVENFINGGIVVGDITAASLATTHLYRPDSDGFPAERSHEIQTALIRSAVRDQWDPRSQTNRFDVQRPMVGQSSVARIGPGCSRTVEHYGGSKRYLVRCWFGAKCMPADIAPLTSPTRLFGSVVLRHRDSDGTLTTYTASRRWVEPGRYTAAAVVYPARLRNLARFTQGVFTLSNTGTHDFWLEYEFDTTNQDDFRVVAFCQRGLVISAHKV